MTKELRDQSEWFIVNSALRSSYELSHSRFEVHLHGALDITMGLGCVAPECRIALAERLARSLGLLADRVWISDTLTPTFLDFGRATNAKLDEVMYDVLALSHLLPLISEGIVRFRPTAISTCSACSSEFEKQLEPVADKLSKIFRKEFRFQERSDGRTAVLTGRCFEPPMIYGGVPGFLEAYPTANSFARAQIEREVRSILWVAREASMTSGSILSNSRLGLAGLLHQEGRLKDRRTLMLLDRDRNINIPWVSELSASQIIQLRNEASEALPSFRIQLAKALTISDDELSPADSSIIEGLRDQALEVKAELQARRKYSARFWKVTYGMLGLGLSAYGVATDQVMPGIAGILPVLQLLISHKTGFESDGAKLSTRPGYVLVKAEELLAHNHN
jgi:hypothetical protein